MRKTTCGVFALGLVMALSVTVAAQEDMTDNPMYGFWAKFAPNATSTYQETTKYHGPEKENYPGGVDSKTVTYKLQTKGKDKVVVTTTVVEEDFLSTVESSPTKVTYPAKVKKANLDAFLQEYGAKPSDSEKVKVGKDEIECKVLAGSYKKGDATVEYKFYYSEMVPGGVVKRTRTTKENDKLVAETTIMLRSYVIPKAKEKEKDKPKEKEKAKEEK